MTRSVKGSCVRAFAAILIGLSLGRSDAVGFDVPAAIPSPHRPQRIITIGPNAAEVVCALGACDRVVAVDKFCVYPPVLADRPRIGGLFDPDLEKIISLRPDGIILRGRNSSIEGLCRQRLIPVYHDRTERLADIPATIIDMGGVLGRQDQAKQLADEFEQALGRIRRRVEGRPRPRVLLTISRRPEPIAGFLTAGKGSFPDEMLSAAGGVNVFGDVDMAYPEVSAEAVIARRPDVVIELLPEMEPSESMQRQMLEHWGKLGSLSVVRENRIFFLTDDNALIPSPRYVEIIEKVSRILHP